MRLRLSAISGVALLALACGAPPSGAPEIVVDRTACSHCGMLVSEPIYAAAYQAAGSDAKVFDDIGCMLESIHREGLRESDAGLRMWFHDGNDGAWIEREQAVFVHSPSIPTPMAGGIVAFRDGAAAERAAGKHSGQVVRSMSELMNLKGDK